MFRKNSTVRSKSSENGTSLKPQAVKPPSAYKKIMKSLSDYQFGESDSRFKILAGLFVVTIISVLSVHISLEGIKAKDKTNYVQKEDGVTEVVYQLNNVDRKDSTLRRFAHDWFKACFTWTGKHEGQIDSGAQFQQFKIPTILDKCQIPINSGIRTVFLKDLVNRYQNDPVFQDKLAPYQFVQSAFREGRQAQIQVQPFYPKKVGEGRWTMDVGATRIIKLGGTTLEEPFNWSLTLSAISPYQDPLLGNQTELGRLLNAWNAQGIRIDNLTRK